MKWTHRQSMRYVELIYIIDKTNVHSNAVNEQNQKIISEHDPARKNNKCAVK